MSYEQFAVKVDERFGQSLWTEFPEIANKGKCWVNKQVNRALMKCGQRDSVYCSTPQIPCMGEL